MVLGCGAWVPGARGEGRWPQSRPWSGVEGPWSRGLGRGLGRGRGPGASALQGGGERRVRRSVSPGATVDTRSSDGAVRPGPFCTRPPRSGAQKCRTTGPGGAVAIATGRAACQATFPGRVSCGRPGARPLAGLGQQGGLEGGRARASWPVSGPERRVLVRFDRWLPGARLGRRRLQGKWMGGSCMPRPCAPAPPLHPGHPPLCVPARPAPAEARRDHALLAGDSGQRRPRRLLGGARARPARCGARQSGDVRRACVSGARRGPCRAAPLDAERLCVNSFGI